MKKTVIVMIVAAMLAVMLSVASAAYVSYSASGFTPILTIYNGTGSSQTITYNTRPTNGQGGVHVGIYRYHDYILEYESGKQFPYFQDVPAMTSNLTTYVNSYMMIYPIITGQLVEGNVTYSKSY